MLSYMISLITDYYQLKFWLCSFVIKLGLQIAFFGVVIVQRKFFD